MSSQLDSEIALLLRDAKQLKTGVQELRAKTRQQQRELSLLLQEQSVAPASSKVTCPR